MAESLDNVSSQSTVNNYAKQGQHFLVRTGNLFVIYFTEEMFMENEDGKTYFHECLETYMKILRQKLSHNRNDFMGLMFGNVTESDEGIENVLTVQKLDICSVNMYTEVMKIYEEDIAQYKSKISSNTCSISNLLLHTVRAYDGIIAKTMARRVIFITCDDNPAVDDFQERHRIRLNAKNYKDINIQLKIVGLGEDWNYERFYKEVEVLSEKTAGRDFKRTNLENLVEEIIYKAHHLTSLQLKIKNDVKVKVSLQGFSTHRRYIKTNSMGKDTNEPLDVYSWYSFKHYGNDEESQELEENPENVKKKQRFGDRDIIFTLKEVRSLNNIHEAGIEILCFRKMSEEDSTYQIQSPLFVGCHVDSPDAELKLFAALLSKMAQKKLVAICVATVRLYSHARLCLMWPSLKLGGFYLYKIPFKEDFRVNLSSVMKQYSFNEGDETSPMNEQQVELMTSIVEKLSLQKFPINFLNIRLQRLLKAVEAIALDLPKMIPPKDNTIPDLEFINERLNDSNLIEQYNELFGEISESTRQETEKFRKLDDETIKRYMENGNFSKLTAATIKTILKSVGQNSSGNKAELVNKLMDYQIKNY